MVGDLGGDGGECGGDDNAGGRIFIYSRIYALQREMRVNLPCVVRNHLQNAVMTFIGIIPSGKEAPALAGAETTDVRMTSPLTQL